MADQHETLTITTVGAQQLAEAAAKARDVDKAITDLKASFAAGNVQTTVYRSELKALTKAQAALEAQMARLAGTSGGGSGGFKGLGGGAMQASYALQDLVAQNGDLLRGFMAIQNNMPGLVMSLGGSAGVAGAISLVSLAISLALPFIAKFIESLSPKEVDKFADAIKTLKDQLKEIEERKVKIGVESSDIENIGKMVEKIEQGLAGFKEWEREHTDFERQSGREVSNILATSPEARAARKQMLEAEQARQQAGYAPLAEARAAKARLEAEMAAAQHAMDTATTDEQFTGAQARLEQLRGRHATATGAVNAQVEAANKQAKATIGDLYKRAKEGDQDAQAELAQRLKTGGFQTLGLNIEFASAEQVARNQEIAAQLERNQEAAKGTRKRDAAAEKDRQLGIALTKQGMEHESEDKQRQRAEAEKERNDEINRARDIAKGQAKARGELASGLGANFLDEAASRQAAIDAMMPGRRRARAQSAFDRQLAARARQQLIASGKTTEEAGLLLQPETAGGVGPVVREHLGQRRAEVAAMAGNLGAGPDAIGPLQQVLAAQRGAIEAQQQQTEAQIRLYQQLGAGFAQQAMMARMNAANFGMVQGPLQSNGYGGPFGGDMSR